MTWPLGLPVGQPQIFYGRVGNTAHGGTYWIKPPGISQVFFFIVSAGGGGGSSAGFGGGGGGAGVVTRFSVQAVAVPDAIEIVCGQGGVGTTGTGGNGTNTLFIALNTRATLLTAGAGQGAGTTTGGVVGVVTAATAWTNMGRMSSVAGGAAGNAGGGGAPTAGIITGGGGGTTGSPAANVPGSLGYPTVIGGTASKGNTGYTILMPLFLSTGGSGGSAGFAGANGGYGSGGGGGGDGSSIGGDGGPGLVMIWSW